MLYVLLEYTVITMFCWVLNVEHGANHAHHYFDARFSMDLANIYRKAKKNTLLHRSRTYLNSTITNAIKSSMFEIV